MFPNEKVIETKTCKHCNKSFNIYEKDVEYLENLSPIIGGQKFLFPEPDMCPFCREQRRFAFRNEGKLFRRKDNYS
ncbi:MAG: hypothetical protein LBC61_07455 [Candidatus Peribacteria bacterium]|jgi:hypothetical protein|nr:hypothetical protein [Candidatus Peribacteria bacterium]